MKWFTFRERDWLAELRLSRHRTTSSTGKLICKGKIELSISKRSEISMAGGTSSFGLKLVSGSSKSAPTMLSLEERSELILTEAIVGRGCSVRVGAGAKCQIGSGTYVADGTKIWASQAITVGSGCAISFGVTIMDDDGHGISVPPYHDPIAIGDNVWIGCNVTVLKGVVIGSGSVIAAGAVVNRSCPPNSLVAGVPGRVVRSGVSWTDEFRKSESLVRGA